MPVVSERRGPREIPAAPIVERPPSRAAPAIAPEAPGTSAPVVTPDRAPARDFDPDLLRRLLPPYKVVVHDNNYTLMDDVVRILKKAVPGMTHERAVALMYEIHYTGAAVPYVGPKEHAEAVAAVIRTIGIKVTVEPDE